jgi:hypothetical protein
VFTGVGAGSMVSVNLAAGYRLLIVIMLFHLAVIDVISLG